MTTNVAAEREWADTVLAAEHKPIHSRVRRYLADLVHSREQVAILAADNARLLARVRLLEKREQAKTPAWVREDVL